MHVEWARIGENSERGRKSARVWRIVRAKVEHTIGVIKRVFGFSKVRYRGLTKNAHRLFVTWALANLFILRRASCADKGRSAPTARCSRTETGKATLFKRRNSRARSVRRP